MEKLIACEIHDYFEAACTHQFELQLSLLNGSIQTGKALDIVSKNKQEFLILQQQGNQLEINLPEIDSVTVLSKNNLFSSFKVVKR
jgi:Rho-binding antiterminator